MKNTFLHILLNFVTLLAYSQTFHGISNSIIIKVPVESKFSSNSQPTEIKIRQGILISGISQPVNFTIGKSAGSSCPKVEVREAIQKETEKDKIPELNSGIPKFYSLIIGVNDYKFNNVKLQDLTNPVNDANKLNVLLRDNYNFQPENSTVLLNPERQEIIKHLEIFASKITPKDNLLIFYAGHGVWDERIKVGYWLPVDAKTDDKSSWISNSTIRDYISGINSKHTLLITDACFSGSILKSREMNLSDLGMSNLYRLPSRKAMTSGTLTTVPDDSKFMFYFLKRLNDTEGKYISARQLFFGLETAVLNNTNTVPQFGVIQDTGDEGGDFIFIRK